MLEGYRTGQTTEEMVVSILGTTPDDLDEDFDTYIRERYAAPLAGLADLGTPPPGGADIQALQTFARAHPGDLVTRLRLGITLFRENRFDEAEEELTAALAIFPEYGGPDSPYWFLAQIHRQRGELEEAEAALSRLNALSESNYDALLEQADLLAELGREEESAAALDRAVLIWPYDMAMHQRLAELHASLGNVDGVVRERGAVVALDPPDRAEALYQLAVAQHGAGDAQGARRSILSALEIAPNYEEALEFLLLLRGTGP
jgi:tetratricopeptide (TPR) repeat protein